MSERFEEIVRRKQVLIDRCAQERKDLASDLSRVRLPLNLGAVLLALGRTLRAYPVVVAGLSGLVISGYGGKISKSAGKLLGLGQILQPLWSWWSRRRKPRTTDSRQ
jgi:hypothetical protein